MLDTIMTRYNLSANYVIDPPQNATEHQKKIFAYVHFRHRHSAAAAWDLTGAFMKVYNKEFYGLELLMFDL